jgi:hypothetical protein
MSTDRFPPDCRDKVLNVRIRPDVGTAVKAWATERRISLAAAVDYLLATHPDIQETR